MVNLDVDPLLRHGSTVGAEGGVGFQPVGRLGNTPIPTETATDYLAAMLAECPDDPANATLRIQLENIRARDARVAAASRRP